MMDSEANPWEMVLAHRFDEAASLYEVKLRASPGDCGLLSAHGTAMLGMGNLSAALDDFMRANANWQGRCQGDSHPYLLDVGMVFWLLGKVREGVAAFKTAVDGILDGSIGYGDLAGGVSQGLLLWYAGITAPDAGASEHALKYLRKLAGKSRIQYWPGPLALFALGESSEEEVLQKACGVGQLDAAEEEANKNLLKRRHLVNSLFYFGVRQRVNGSEEQCRQWMRRCFALENPIVECEWYLARGEVAAAGER